MAPLISHRFCDAMEGSAAFLPSVRAGGHPVNPVLSPVNHVGWGEVGEVLQPQAGGFGFAMPELPGLDDLIWLSDLRADDADRILYRNMLDRSLHKRLYEAQSLFLLCLLVLEPPGARNGQVRARRVSNHQIPVVVDDVHHVALVVKFWIFLAGKEIAGISIESPISECIPNRR